MSIKRPRLLKRASVTPARSAPGEDHITPRRHRSRLQIIAVAVLAAAGTLASLSVAAPAQAAVCATEGVAYLTQPGHIYFSGFNGDRSLGVPHLVVYQDQPFSYGGNGIGKNSNGIRAITWQAIERDELSGDPIAGIDFLNGKPTDTQVAGSNCVANEKGPYPVTAPPGLYEIDASYTPGNHPGMSVVDHVADLQVLP